MKQHLAREHLHFFETTGFLELENLLSAKKAAETKAKAEGLLSATPCNSAEERYCAERDLWRRDPLIKSVSCAHSFAEFASELSKEKSVRLAFAHFHSSSFPVKTSLLPAKTTLLGISSIQPLSIGLLLNLSENSIHEFQEQEIFCPLPKNPGDGIFFSAKIPIDLQRLLQTPQFSFLLLAYSPKKAIYSPQKIDPARYLLKQDGYIPGEPIKEPFHPLLSSERGTHR